MLPKNLPAINSKSLNQCFACGQDNPIGLKLKFSWDGKTARAEFTPTELHQGWQGVLHGGIIYTLLKTLVASPQIGMFQNGQSLLDIIRMAQGTHP